MLSTATMQRHPDYGFLPKTQPDLNPVVHMSPYRRSQYNITGIMISFRIAGLATGDTPDAPHNHLGIRGPSSSPEVPTCVTKIGCHTRISYEELGRWTEDPYLVREYLPRTMSRRKRIPRITEDIRQDIIFHRLSPSINTRHQGEVQSNPQWPDNPELLDVVVSARRLSALLTQSIRLLYNLSCCLSSFSCLFIGNLCLFLSSGNALFGSGGHTSKSLLARDRVKWKREMELKNRSSIIWKLVGNWWSAL
ncbi:hypothetical protein F511_15283 [Dorcoceras hygrometricum]|uniref:Uncharacterized protein n=1 Tax=Dorcoceras hygrometricum TaxID=472368 RepID=A0A2Z7AFF3_9LAMI|nr:hypothetical protein F511_15283 [Dorcoceras hygrometricum]